MTAAQTVTAKFVKAHSITLNVTFTEGSGKGSITSTGISCNNDGGDCTEGYLDGQAVTFTATPDKDSRFAGWVGDIGLLCQSTISQPTCKITFNENMAATFTGGAVFGPKLSLSVAKDGNGTGKVTGTPGGIDCGTTCTAKYLTGDSVTLKAVPDAGSTFTKWQGRVSAGTCSNGITASCTVTLADSESVIATFTKQSYALSVTKSGDGAGSVASSPEGIICGADCSETYLDKAVITLTATAEAGSTFTGWNGCTGTTTSCSVTMTAAKTVTATFKKIPSYLLTVAKSGNGSGSVSSSPVGIDCGTDCKESYLDSTIVTLNAISDAGSMLSGWSGGCTGTGTCSVTMTKTQTVTAKFVKKHNIALNVTFTEGSGAGSIIGTGINCNNSGGDCTEDYPDGTMTLTATPDKDSRFVGWVGDMASLCQGQGANKKPACKITFTTTMAASFTGGAVFGPKLVLNVFKDGTGTGKVTGTPGAIDCGANCTAKYLQGDTITLTAKPDADSTFTKWTSLKGVGTCYDAKTVTCKVAMNDSVIPVYATFTRKPVTLTVAKSGTGASSGTVSSSPTGITCGKDCSEPYVVNTQVTLTATVKSPATFTGWSGGGCSGTAATCTVTMTAATKVTAAFKK
ncbi:hypothetical protein CRENPOLYSF2_3550001 [Crenothrix polyspora]|uniref:Bacterial repeat domain-containing protein n=2 Tax=Crenothrix polyspora TaxID=360316 RepID=A0A1R4HC07_9GAMM|nr:hypothetical protein CRENPOLYSF2_3550001 [Crenothrix polyspora]